MVINAAAYQRIAFYFVLAAIYYRRHFGKAETVQIPARFTVNFEIFDFGHVPRLLTPPLVSRRHFASPLAAIYYRRHFGKAETVQSPARFTVNFEIFDFGHVPRLLYHFEIKNQFH